MTRLAFSACVLGLACAAPISAQAAEEALMRGFTSLRDVGGASWGAKLAADRGEIAGPRVWPSLRTLSQFGGHGDANPRFVNPREFGGPENNLERLGYSRIVNGRDDVLAAARENLNRDASQIKMHLAGGVGTEFDPIDGRQFTRDEIEAAVEVAEGFGTYVAAHVYTPDGTEQAIEAGVKSIEPGNLITDEIAQMMAENGVWLSPQVVVYLTFSPGLGPVRLAKGKMVEAGLDTMFKLAKKHDLKIAFGTDVVVNPEACADRNREFVERAGPAVRTHGEGVASVVTVKSELALRPARRPPSLIETQRLVSQDLGRHHMPRKAACMPAQNAARAPLQVRGKQPRITVGTYIAMSPMCLVA